MGKIYDRFRQFFGTRYFVHRVPENFGERARMWAKNSLLLRLIILSPVFYFLFAVVASASAFPWFKNPEERYNKAIESRIESEQRLLADLIEEHQTRGDLSFDKAETAAAEQNLEELNRLTGVAQEMKQNIEFLETEGVYFKPCFRNEKGTEHCFPQALLK